MPTPRIPVSHTHLLHHRILIGATLKTIVCSLNDRQIWHTLFFQLFNSDMEPNDVRSMCCRLRLDLRELRKKAVDFFGSGESTGSIGVVTSTCPVSLTWLPIARFLQPLEQTDGHFRPLLRHQA